MKLPATASGSNPHKPVIHVCLNDDVKLNESDSAWRPTRYVRAENADEEEVKTQVLISHQFTYYGNLIMH